MEVQNGREIDDNRSFIDENSYRALGHSISYVCNGPANQITAFVLVY